MFKTVNQIFKQKDSIPSPRQWVQTTEVNKRRACMNYTHENIFAYLPYDNYR